jgi:hypothetical protein
MLRGSSLRLLLEAWIIGILYALSFVHLIIGLFQ